MRGSCLIVIILCLCLSCRKNECLQINNLDENIIEQRTYRAKYQSNNKYPHEWAVLRNQQDLDNFIKAVEGNTQAVNFNDHDVIVFLSSACNPQSYVLNLTKDISSKEYTFAYHNLSCKCGSEIGPVYKYIFTVVNKLDPDYDLIFHESH